jgi:hypothetical protein
MQHIIVVDPNRRKRMRVTTVVTQQYEPSHLFALPTEPHTHTHKIDSSFFVWNVLTIFDSIFVLSRLFLSRKPRHQQRLHEERPNNFAG